MTKTLYSILKVLSQHSNEIIGAKEISKDLKFHGVDLSERTVRYHLKILDEQGFTKVYGKQGRQITKKGQTELTQSMVSEKIGFVYSRIEALSYLSDFNLDKQKGNIVLNISFFPKNRLREAITVMRSVFSSPFIMSKKVVIKKSGEEIGGVVIPEGKVGLGTICSVTINSVFLKEGIPIASKFGGILQIENALPSRFLSLISYNGTSLDPHEIFIKSGMTDVTGAVSRGSGKILASFREIPVVTISKAKELNEQMKAKGLGGILVTGGPNKPLLDITVGLDRAGIIVVGGLNPIAILEENNIPTESKATSTLFEYSELIDFDELI